MDNSNTCLKEPLLIQRQRHSQEEYDENEYWENHANGIVEHAKKEKNTFLRASLNDMNVLAGIVPFYVPKSRQSTETTFPTPTTKLWRNSARSASLHQSGAEWRIPSAMSSAQSASQKQDENQNGSVSLEAGTVSKDLVSLPRPLYVTDLATPPSYGSQFRVAYQGARGAYSEAAALKAYPQCEVVPCEQFEEAFQVVELRLVDKAVLPIENSLGGSIHRNYDLLLSHRLHIGGEVQLAAHHCLLGLPGVKKEELKRVVSHPQVSVFGVFHIKLPFPSFFCP